MIEEAGKTEGSETFPISLPPTHSPLRKAGLLVGTMRYFRTKVEVNFRPKLSRRPKISVSEDATVRATLGTFISSYPVR